jgi:hypothetical protein
MTTDELLTYLRAVDAAKRQCGPPPPGYLYSSLEGMVLALGRTFRQKPLPADVAVEKMGQCFRNAQGLSEDRDGLTYVEGFAGSRIPLGHGWCVTASGEIVDPTWPDMEPARSYFGIPIQPARVIEARRWLEKRDRLPLLEYPPFAKEPPSSWVLGSLENS